VGIQLETDAIPHYGCQVYFKKDFSAVDKAIDIRFEVTDNGTLNQVIPKVIVYYTAYLSYFLY